MTIKYASLQEKHVIKIVHEDENGYLSIEETKLIYLLLDEVKKFCEEYGITLEVEEKEDDTAAAGTILSQSRAAGSEIAERTTLKITVAKKTVKTTTDDNTNTNNSGSNDNMVPYNNGEE